MVKMTYEYPNMSDFGDLLTYPTQGDSSFWLWILVGIFFIFSFTSYFGEVKLFGKGKILSSLVVSGFFVSCLALLGSVVGFVSKEIFIYIIVFFAILLAIFFFSGDD